MTQCVRGFIISGVLYKYMKVGDTVRFIGCTETHDYLNCDFPDSVLLKGNTYLIEKSETLVDGYSYLDRIELIGVKGRFNADCFELATGCIRQSQPNKEQ